MKHGKVGSVMTTDVVRAEYATPFEEAARRLADHRISGLPVVDERDEAIGVLSEPDLMPHQADAPAPHAPQRRTALHVPMPGAGRRAAKADARTTDHLTHRLDDAALRADAQALHGAADERPGRL
ncbi:CBS domain-containing protein [Streptomyces zaehneri]|uniref:CBS domain-containing protein n=1 Tax=Streptomyces zaehneri TaxID=3051180 RepID=UPI0028D2D48C|nr:CBS domain-containing protein [Streptomyces sp. DSM 40713]